MLTSAYPLRIVSGIPRERIKGIRVEAHPAPKPGLPAAVVERDEEGAVDKAGPLGALAARAPER